MNVDLKTALDMVHLARAAYMKDTGKVWTDEDFRKTGYKVLDEFEAKPNDLYGYFASRDDQLAVVFRGMRSIEDFFLNGFTISMTDGGCGWMHRGLYGAYQALARHIQFGFDRWLEDGMTKVYATGHSMGGALATMLGAHWRYTGHAMRHPNLEVYSFGEPRVGDVDFANTYFAKHFRFVNADDFITTLPPRMIPGTIDPPRFYSHVGLPLVLTDDKRLIETYRDVRHPQAEMARYVVMSGTPDHNKAAALFTKGLMDHRSANYVAKLEALVS